MRNPVIPAWLSAPWLAIRAVARNGGLRSLLLASALQTTCRWVLVVTLLLVAYQIGGAIAVGVVGLVRTLPALATIPAAALLGGRRREHVLSVLVAVRATVVVAAAATLAFQMPGILFVATGIDAFAGTLRRPVHAALMPSLARTPEELVAANVATNFSENAGSLVGPILGGLLLAAFGPVWALMVAGLGLVLAAGLVATVRDVHPGVAPESGAPSTTGGGVPNVAAGARTVLGTPGVRLVGGLVLVDALVRGALAAAVVVIAVRGFGDGGAVVGMLSGMPGLGGLIGVGLAFVALSIGRLAAPLILGLLAAAGAVAVSASVSGLVATAVVLAVAGVASAIVRVASTTMLQEAVRRDVRTGAMGALEGMVEGAVGIGAIGASVLIDSRGMTQSMAAIGLAVGLVAAASWRPLRRFERTIPAPGRGFEMVAAMPLFAPLPLDVLDEIADRLVPVTFAPGSALTVEGEIGADVYLIASGEVDVLIGGTLVRTLGTGAMIGEIALIRRVPRTATVVARDLVEAFRLDGESFIAAATGQARAVMAAEAVVTAHLTADAARGS